MLEKTRLDGLLFAIMGDQILVERWWNRPNQAFDGALPIDVFVLRPERVRDYIFNAANLGGDYC
jgi:hypothetical protein